MTESLYFSKGSKKISELFRKEEIPVTDELQNNLLSLLSKICTYEEEERKIRPSIIIGTKIDKAIKQIPTCYKLSSFKDDLLGNGISKAFKALVPFCTNGWHVYINIKSNTLEYGLLRAFPGPQGLSITELLFDDIGSSVAVKYRLIEIKAVNNFQMKFLGLKGGKLIINYSFVPIRSNLDSFSEMIEDLTLGYTDGRERKILLRVFEKLIKLTSERVHGTICLVVKSNCKVIRKIMPDGIWLREPVDLAREALEAVKTKKDTPTIEKYYGLSGLLLEMMNIDGMTVLDSTGKILAFNVFVNNSKVKKVNEGGGARKRAALSVIESECPDIIGVYFQSQDGLSFYKRMKS